MTAAVKWSIIGAFVLAAIGTGVMRQYALKQKLLDIPNVRSSHSSAMPRGGGLAIVAAFFAALLGIAFVTNLDSRLLTALLAGGSAIALIGFLDDHRTLSAGLRLSVHIGMALLAVAMLGGMPDGAFAAWGLHGAWIGGLIAMLTLIWSTNLFNFMDGIDGIAASEAIFLATAGAALTWFNSGDTALTGVLLCLAAAGSGFLLWNWPPARIFMGDVGSGFLGFTIATLGLATIQRDSIPVEAWGILGGVFLVDATVTLLKRMLRGERWLEAHRTHAYQHLTRRYRAHRPVTMIVIAIDLFWLLPWACLSVRNPAHALGCLAAALIPLVVLALASGAGDNER